jgi:hypothetical protein
MCVRNCNVHFSIALSSDLQTIYSSKVFVKSWSTKTFGASITGGGKWRSRNVMENYLHLQRFGREKVVRMEKLNNHCARRSLKHV